MPLPPLSARRRHTHCRYHTRRLHACRCHTRRYTDRHCHAGTGQQHPSHSTTATGPLVTPYLPQPRPPPNPLPLTVHPSPEAAGKWPEDTSNPPVHGQHTGTLGMVHPQLCSVAQHQPN